MYIIVGLGNPGEEYEKTRHNVGRLVLDYYAKKNKFQEWLIDTKLKALTCDGKIGKSKVKLIQPETFMNKSGLSVKTIITSKKKAEKLVVVYDDLDLGLGEIKISYNKGTGGHKGLESIIKQIKTKEFIRVRVGISHTNTRGIVKKPKGDEKILNFLIKDFSKKDFEIFKKSRLNITKALDSIVLTGRLNAMNKFN